MKRTIIAWTWEFPQTFLGYLFTKFYDVEWKEDYRSIHVYAGKFPSGISLGLYILLSNASYKYNLKLSKQHEYGHTRQSLYLGPLYLVTVGLASVTWNALRRISSRLREKDYYSIWPENWADKLGGVVRNE